MIRKLVIAVWICISAHASERIHVVEPGERVPRLEWLYGVSADQIRAANGLESDDLKAGARLIIPGTAPGEGAAPRAEPAPILRAEPVVREAPVEVEEAAPTPASSNPAPKVRPTSRDLGESTRSAIGVVSARGLKYNGRWTPPGESAAWAMDCSNTTRWLVRETQGISLPRTASDQYEFMRKQRRLWRVRPSTSALRKRLKPGDLLFWENTYRPVRKPPVTHVMVYLGADSAGQMWMAGSQSSKGPNVYKFNPEMRMGGYRIFWFFRRDGRFVAYARP